MGYTCLGLLDSYYYYADNKFLQMTEKKWKNARNEREYDSTSRLKFSHIGAKKSLQVESIASSLPGDLDLSSRS